MKNQIYYFFDDMINIKDFRPTKNRQKVTRKH